MPKAAARRARASSAPVYDVHPAVNLMMKWVASLKEKTGRSVEEWVTYIDKEGPKTEAERRDWLKREHNLGTNTCWWLAERSVGKGEDEDTPEKYLESAATYVEGMYAGPKAGLRPIHEALVKAGRAVARDVKVCPCKTIVPLFRNHVFAQIKPSTRARIDLGFALGPLIKQGKKIPSRLEDTGGFAKKDRITHRIAITSVEDIDDDVRKWLKTAYELDGKG
jgi:hypothetical protein